MPRGDLLERVKLAAQGRWPDLLQGLGGLSHELLDGQHHPCPKCGGTDRFRALDLTVGGLFCNQCFSEKNGDGIAALQWLTGEDFKTILQRLADHLGVPVKTRKRPEDELEILPWNDALVFAWTRHKPGVTPEAVHAAGGGLAKWRDFHVVYLPILPVDPAARPVGYVVWNSTGAPLRRRNGQETKMLVTPGSKSGWIGRHGLQLLHEGRAELTWKVEGPTDLLALWAALPEEDRGRVAVLTNPFGSTEKPRADLLELLRGRRVFVIHDEDDAGRKGGERWTHELIPVAGEVRRVRLPAEGLDVRDFLSDPARGGYEALHELAQGALAETPPPPLRAIRNFTVEEIPGPNGETRQELHAVPLPTIAAQTLEITQGGPHLWEGEFFHELQDGRIRFLERPADLFAFLHRSCGLTGSLSWRDGGLDSGGVSLLTKPEYFSGLKGYVENFEEITDYFYHPRPKGVYLTGRYRVTEAPPSKGTAIWGLLKFFRPAQVVDEALIFAFLLTLFWGGPPGQRPFFLVTGPEGAGVQETGKTSLVEKLSSLVGGVFRLQMDERDRTGDPIGKQLLSERASRLRCALLDNLEGQTASRELAELLTAESVHGRPAYGRQRQRSNRITWAGTAVAPALDSDLSSRTFVIQLKPPDRDQAPTWEHDVTTYIEDHRLEIMRDVLDTLKGPRFPITARHSRFPAWDRDVLACSPYVDEVLTTRARRIRQIDADSEGMELFLDALSEKLPGRYAVAQLAEVWEVATRQRISSISLGRRLKAAMARQKLPLGLYLSSEKSHKRTWLVNPSQLHEYKDGLGAGGFSNSEEPPHPPPVNLEFLDEL